MADRDNEAWLTDLNGSPEARNSALAVLRAVLLRNLSKGLSHVPHADDSFIDDAVQDSLLRILERLNQFEGRSGFITWATAIAIRTAMTELRRKRWKDVSLNDLLSDSESGQNKSTDARTDPAWQAEQISMVARLYEIIDTQLTEKQRSALLAEMKGMPQNEIARQMGSNRNAIYKLTHDARKRIKRELLAAGYRPEDFQAPVTQ